MVSSITFPWRAGSTVGEREVFGVGSGHDELRCDLFAVFDEVRPASEICSNEPNRVPSAARIASRPQRCREEGMDLHGVVGEAGGERVHIAVVERGDDPVGQDGSTAHWFFLSIRVGLACHDGQVTCLRHERTGGSPDAAKTSSESQGGRRPGVHRPRCVMWGHFNSELLTGIKARYPQARPQRTS
jgi:hypothetical protein